MRTFPFSLLALALVACGGSSSTTGAPPGADSGAPDSSTGTTGEDGGGAEDGGASVTADQACSDNAHARCVLFDSCSDSTYDAVHYGDEAACETAVKATCIANLGAAGTGATPATVEACAQATPTESCVDYLGDNPPAACATPAGTGASGSACAASAQCQSTFCAVNEYAVCGVCAAVPASGAACNVNGDCGSRGGLQCYGGACIAYVAQGGACTKPAQCGIGLTCVGVTKTAQGACQPAGATVGATCDTKGETSPRCDTTLDLACIGTACAAEIIVAASDTCGTVSAGVARCGSEGTCVLNDAGPPAKVEDAGDSDGGDGGATDVGDAGVGEGGASDAGAPTTGTCLAAAATGAACDPTNGPACVLPAKCVIATEGGTTGICTQVIPSACH